MQDLQTRRLVTYELAKSRVYTTVLTKLRADEDTPADLLDEVTIQDAATSWSAAPLGDVFRGPLASNQVCTRLCTRVCTCACVRQCPLLDERSFGTHRTTWISTPAGITDSVVIPQFHSPIYDCHRELTKLLQTRPARLGGNPRHGDSHTLTCSCVADATVHGGTAPLHLDEQQSCDVQTTPLVAGLAIGAAAYAGRALLQVGSKWSTAGSAVARNYYKVCVPLLLETVGYRS